MKILVTGGAGFIGSWLVEHLSKKHKVTIWDDLSTGKEENVPNDIKLQRVNVAHNIPHGSFDVIYHLAAESRIGPSFENPVDTTKRNVIGTQRILDLALRCKAKVIFASTSCLCGDKYLNPYALSKAQGEDLIKMYRHIWGLNAVITRFFNVYGAGEPQEGPHASVLGIFRRLRQQGKALTINGTGEQRRDFIHVTDIARALEFLMDKDVEEIVQIGTGKNYSINELAEIVDPGGNHEYRPARDGELMESLADPSLLLDLGWKPKVDLPTWVGTMSG